MHLEEDPKRIAPRAWFQVMCIVSLVSNNLSRKHGLKQFIPPAWFQTVSRAPVLRDSFDLKRLTTVTPLDLSPRNQHQQKSTATHTNNRTNQEKQKNLQQRKSTETARNGHRQGVIKTLLGSPRRFLEHQRNCQGGSLLMFVPADVFVAVSSLLLVISIAIAFCCC